MDKLLISAAACAAALALAGCGRNVAPTPPAVATEGTPVTAPPMASGNDTTTAMGAGPAAADVRNRQQLPSKGKQP